jgi:hypothetical protein
VLLLWNYRPVGALLFMSNDLSRTGHQQVAGVSPELDATAKETRPKWRERLQRGLLKIWLVFSAFWVGCILLQSRRDVYCRFRNRIWAACRRAIDVPGGHWGFETRSPQPMI